MGDSAMKNEKPWQIVALVNTVAVCLLGLHGGQIMIGIVGIPLFFYCLLATKFLFESLERRVYLRLISAALYAAPAVFIAYLNLVVYINTATSPTFNSQVLEAFYPTAIAAAAYWWLGRYPKRAAKVAGQASQK
jgi:hypothetical protein